MSYQGAIIKARRVTYLHSILEKAKTTGNSMLYSFFITQWHNPSPGDWTEQIKLDLKDLEIPCDFKFIQSKSKYSFKRLVKARANVYALKLLQNKQSTHSKMKNLAYDTLKMQSYFLHQSINPKVMRLIFRYRTKMENFSENYRGSNGPKLCPLCNVHIDSQELSFSCNEIKNEFTITVLYSEIFEEDLKMETIETIKKNI